LLPPERSKVVLYCLVDPSDLSGLVNRVDICAGSIRFLIDNARTGLGGWACDASRFANNLQADLSEVLGELEIKAEPIRFLACSTFDLLQDAGVSVETWLFDKINRGFRNTINKRGHPRRQAPGTPEPQGGILICETSANFSRTTKFLCPVDHRQEPCFKTRS
jgi:HK97 family phage major capsid protein